jgi:hypothetical protein
MGIERIASYVCNKRHTWFACNGLEQELDGVKD